MPHNQIGQGSVADVPQTFFPFVTFGRCSHVAEIVAEKKISFFIQAEFEKGVTGKDVIGRIESLYFQPGEYTLPFGKLHKQPIYFFRIGNQSFLYEILCRLDKQKRL
jgi:hypothetical protein